MKMLKPMLVLSESKNELKKRRLQNVIDKKRILLEQLIIQSEMLRVNLEIAKQEYMVKVGSLFLKDNQLDLEIIRLRNILHLMREGMTYDEALNKIAATYYAEQLELDREQENMRFEEEIYHKRETQQPQLLDEVKKIWKKLIAKFHPDLVQDPNEKKKRDTIMKQINKAYQEADYESLMKIDQENLDDHEATVENLEEILIRILREIDQQENTFRELKQSEWYDWMIKIERAKKKDQNIFAETEKQLLNDIVTKLDLVKSLKAEMNQL